MYAKGFASETNPGLKAEREVMAACHASVEWVQHTHTHTHTRTQTHKHTQTNTHTHKHTHRHTNTHTDTQTHTHAHTHTHTQRLGICTDPGNFRTITRVITAVIPTRGKPSVMSRV